MKANLTDLSITNYTIPSSLGLTIRSIERYEDRFETIEHTYAEDLKPINTLHVAHFKALDGWTGCVSSDRGVCGYGCK